MILASARILCADDFGQWDRELLLAGMQGR